MKKIILILTILLLGNFANGQAMSNELSRPVISVAGDGYTHEFFFMNTDTSRSVTYRASLGVDEDEFQQLVVDYYLNEWGLVVNFLSDGTLQSVTVSATVLQIYVFPELNYKPHYFEGCEPCQLEESVLRDYGIVLILNAPHVHEGNTLPAGTTLVVGQYIFEKVAKNCGSSGQDKFHDPIMATWSSDKTRVVAGTTRLGIFDCLIEMDHPNFEGLVGVVAGITPEAVGSDPVLGTHYRWIATHFYPDV